MTGGTDGVGKEIALGLARAGVRVLLVGRDADKGARAVTSLVAASGAPHVEFLAADLSLMRQVDRLANEVMRRVPSLRYLVHSAGIVRGRHTRTAEGVETNFAVNYLGRFALTKRLLPLLQATAAWGVRPDRDHRWRRAERDGSFR